MSTRIPLRRGRALATALLLAASGAAALAVAPPAHADSRGIELSSDGVHYGRVLTAPLFDPAELMIPRSSQASGFWIRNASGAPAYLRVSIADVLTTDAALASALTVAAATGSDSGSRVALSEASPCAVLTEGQVIPSGGTLHVSTDIALGDLQGSAGQNASADFRLRVNLSSVNLAGADRYACLADSGEVPGFYSGTTTTGASRSTAQGFASTGGSDVTVGAAVPDDGSAIAGGSEAEGERLAAAWNSADLDQWWVILLWVGGVLIGGLAMLGRERLRSASRSVSTASTTTSATPENGAAS